MFPERVYRWLLVVYPREHRREYGELMVQLFRDRMRSDGSGFRGLVVCVQMIFDLVRAAYQVHKEGFVMPKRMWIGTALVVVLLAGVAGVANLWHQDQSTGGVKVSMVSVMQDTKTFPGDGSDEASEAIRQAVEEGVITEEIADMLLRAFNERHAGIPGARKNKEARRIPLMVSGWNGSESTSFFATGSDELAEALRQAVEGGSINHALVAEIMRPFYGEGLLSELRHFHLSGADGLSEALRQALEEYAINHALAAEIVRASDRDGPVNKWLHLSFSEADGIAEPIWQAVQEGAISQELADEILQSFDGGNAGG